MNQTLQVLETRFSCRAFADALPDNEKLQAIAQAAIQSPSSRNSQRWQVIMVRDTALIAEMESEGFRALSLWPDRTLLEIIQSRGGRLFYGAPCVVVIAIEPSELTGAALDCGIVCQSIAVAAQSLGLATCICGLAGLAFQHEKAAYFKEKLRFSAGYEFGMAVLVGRAQNITQPHQPNQAKITWID